MDDSTGTAASKPTNKVSVIINGVKGEVSAGKTLLEAAEEIGAGIGHLCFGNAICSTCRVSIVAGAKSLSPKEIKEKVSLDYHLCFDENVRLACQVKIVGPAPVIAAAPKPFDRWRPKDKKGAQKASEADVSAILNPVAPSKTA